MERIAFLGCSRGLGKEVLQAWDSSAQAFAFARNLENLKKIATPPAVDLKVQSFDFSKENKLEEWVSSLQDLKLDRLFYFAGGGPYGLYSQKAWKDHQWALQVSFLTPALLLHKLTEVGQVIFIGSAVADSKADPRAASYSAAKHGLKGLVSSLIAEGDSRDLRLFRPGYMNTDLLPPHADPREQGAPILEPESVAQQFVRWARDPQGEPLLKLDS